MAEHELPNRVEKTWEEWRRKHPQPPFESRYYNDRKLTFLMRLKKDFEKLPMKTKEEEATIRKLDAEAQQLRKPVHPGLTERSAREMRNPVARFIAQFLSVIREMKNKWRESVGRSSEKPSAQKLPLPPQRPAKEDKKRVPYAFPTKKEQSRGRSPEYTKIILDAHERWKDKSKDVKMVGDVPGKKPNKTQDRKDHIKSRMFVETSIDHKYKRGR